MVVVVALVVVVLVVVVLVVVVLVVVVLVVVVLVCLFSIEIQMAGQTGMKFGMKVVLEGRRFLGFFDPVPPTLQGQGA